MKELKGHERNDKTLLESLKKQIELDGVLKRPIVADRTTNVVLDGHHRIEALRLLGYKEVPVVFVNYSSPDICVQGWNGINVTKEMVISAGLSGNKLPPKTSKHMIEVNGERMHISAIETMVNIRLSKLKRIGVKIGAWK